MTRAAQRPKTDNDHQPDQDDLWDQVEGDSPDTATRQALNLAHRAAEKFPALSSRYKSFAGPAVIASGALMALAGVAVARRLRRGQHPDEIIDQITSEEIENAATVTSRQNRVLRMIRRIAKRRNASKDQTAS
ncbi:MAG: hypothetical protein WD939_04160 [Dehalococcoidia bacterium]